MKRMHRKVKKVRSLYRVTIPSFLAGIGSVLNIGGGYYADELPRGINLPDRSAIAHDFANIGQDIRYVLSKKDPIGSNKESNQEMETVG